MLLSLANGSPADVLESSFRKFGAERLLDGLRAMEGGLPDPRHSLARIGMEFDGDGRAVRNGLSVFGAARQAERDPDWAGRAIAAVAEIRAAIRNTHQTPLRFLLWAGVGAAAADVSLYQAAGLLKRGPRCYVVDSAEPAKLKAVLDDIERRTGLSVSSILRGALVVGTADGPASYEPLVVFEKLANLYDRQRIDGRPHFLSLAAEGSPLDGFARERGFQRAEGGQGGPLARGSLYPLAMARADLGAWIRNACLSEKDIGTAWRLASFLHAQGTAGRDKVTLLAPKPWAGTTAWTKRTFEAALGQDEKLGLKIVPCARPRLASYRAPKDPQQDRVFLAVRAAGMEGPDSAKIALLRHSGYPLAVLTLPRGSLLARYMQFVHYCVFGLAWLRGLNFAARPAADLEGSIAQRIFAEAQEAGGAMRTSCWKQMASSPRRIPFRGDLVFHYNRLDIGPDPGGMDAPQAYAAILRSLVADRRIDCAALTFFGDTRYSPAGVAVRRILDRAAEALFERRLNIPADVHEGPAVLHSCQETILGHGRCLATVLLSEAQEPLAAARYAPDYHVAQFLATQSALAERGRPVVAIVVRDLGEAELRALDEFFHRAASYLKPGRF